MANITSRSVRILQADDYIYAINNAGTQEGRSLVSDLTALIGGSSSNKEEITQSAHGFVKYDALAFNGTSYVKAQADTADNSSVVGIVDELIDGNTFSITYGGLIPWDVANTPDRVAGNDLWLSQNTAGLVVDTEPSLDVGQVRQYVGEALVSGLLVNIDLGQEVSASDDTKVVQLIDADMTLYLDPSGSDTTGDGTLANPWYSPHKAYRYLDDYRIGGEVTVTIQAAAGTYNFTEGLIINHPRSGNIFLTGDALNGVTPVEGDFVASAATNDTFLRGRYSTIFEFDGSSTRITVNGASHFVLSNLMITTTNANGGQLIHVRDNSHLRTNGPLAFHGSNSNCVVVSGSSNIRESSASEPISVTNAGANGIVIEEGSTAESSIIAVGNSDSGISIQQGSHAFMNDSYSKLNKYGFYVVTNSALYISGNATVAGAHNNSNRDFEINNGSMAVISDSILASGDEMRANTGSYINSGSIAGVTYSPAFGTIGNNDSIIN